MIAVYILFSEKDHKTYVGSTSDLERRLSEHDQGYCKSTKNRRPLRLVYSEEFDKIDEARKREKYFKTTSGRRELKKIFKDL